MQQLISSDNSVHLYYWYWLRRVQFTLSVGLSCGKPTVIFDVTTSYNSVDKAAWLGKVTSQRHACRTGNKMAAWTVAMAKEKKQRCHVNVFSGTAVNWTCCVFFVTSNRFSPVKKTLGWRAVVFCACEITQLLSVVFCVVRAVSEFEFRFRIKETSKKRSHWEEGHAVNEIYIYIYIYIYTYILYFKLSPCT
jgi:hypothetical protein